MRNAGGEHAFFLARQQPVGSDDAEGRRPPAPARRSKAPGNDHRQQQRDPGAGIDAESQSPAEEDDEHQGDEVGRRGGQHGAEQSQPRQQQQIQRDVDGQADGRATPTMPARSAHQRYFWATMVRPNQVQ